MPDTVENVEISIMKHQPSPTVIRRKLPYQGGVRAFYERRRLKPGDSIPQSPLSIRLLRRRLPEDDLATHSIDQLMELIDESDRIVAKRCQ